MPIERGEDWGWQADESGPFPMCNDDAAVAAAIEAQTPIVRLADGDLARTLGMSAAQLARPSSWHVPIDALRVTLDDGVSQIVAAHVVVGRWFESAGWCGVLNAAFIDTRNWAPRAHPGDGFADIVTAGLSIGDRFKAQRRALTGSHVPHPDIAIRRSREATLQFDKARPVRLDGNASTRAKQVHFEVIPNAIVVAV